MTLPPVAMAALLLVGGAVVYSQTTNEPLSLAGDVGHTDADACAVVARYSSWVVPRLDASGFPHASNAPVETYRLVRTDTHTIEAAITINWVDRHASCASLTPETPYTVSFNMGPQAYRALVAELTSVIQTGALTPHHAKNAAWVAADTGVTLADGSSGFDYKMRLAGWAMGEVLEVKQ